MFFVYIDTKADHVRIHFKRYFTELICFTCKVYNIRSTSGLEQTPHTASGSNMVTHTSRPLCLDGRDSDPRACNLPPVIVTVLQLRRINIPNHTKNVTNCLIVISITSGYTEQHIKSWTKTEYGKGKTNDV